MKITQKKQEVGGLYYREETTDCTDYADNRDINSMG